MNKRNKSSTDHNEDAEPLRMCVCRKMQGFVICTGVCLLTARVHACASAKGLRDYRARMTESSVCNRGSTCECSPSFKRINLMLSPKRATGQRATQNNFIDISQRGWRSCVK